MTSEDRWLLPEGVDEMLPRQAAVAERVRRDILDLYQSWGYQLVIPPLMEFTDSLLIGLGDDIAHQSFRLTDQISGKPMAIRADITPQTARIDAHSMQASGINRLCYAGSVLHTRAKSLLGSRCPIQAGAELYGEPGINADTEVISLMLAMLEKVDASYACGPGNGGSALHKLTLDLGHVDIYRAVIEALQRAQPDLDSDCMARISDAVQKKSVADLREWVPTAVADKKLAEIICQLPTLCGGREVLGEARKMLKNIAADDRIERALDQLSEVAATIEQRFADVSIYFDLTELRGYAYHTGLVFAAYADGHGSALANGGRYDEVGKVFGSARPATGFNTDVKSLINFIYGEHPSLATAADGGVNSMASSDLETGAAIAAPDIDDDKLWRKVQSLRSEGLTVVNVKPSEIDKYPKRISIKKGAWVVS